MAVPTIEELKDELDPEAEASWILFDESPEAQVRWIGQFLSINNELGSIVRMRPYPQQIKMLEDETGRDITVKGRQTRASSLKIARNVRDMTMGKLWGAQCVVGAQDDATTEQFRQRIRHHILVDLKPRFNLRIGTDNENELVIAGMENKFIFVSGQQAVISRGYATQRVHISELAHWTNKAKELLGGMLPAVPSPPFGKVDFESTPRGEIGAFYDYAMDAKPFNDRSLWTVHLYPWWLEPRYRVTTNPLLGMDIVLTPDHYNQLMFEFKPNEHERMLMEVHGLDIDQILWRQIKKPEQDKTPAPFLQEYPEDLDTCWLGVEGKFFDTPDGVDNLQFYRDERHKPKRFYDKLTYKGGEISFFGSNLAIYEMPDQNDTYVAGFDAAGGGSGTEADWSVLYMWSVKKEKIVARLRVQATPKVFAGMVCAVATFYHNAMVNGERSHHGAAVFENMKELHYQHFYYHVDPRKGLKKGQTIDPGCYPTAEIRGAALEKFRTGIVGLAIRSEDDELVREMNVFTWQKYQNRIKVMAMDAVGLHDDCIFAAAYGWFIIDKARSRLRSDDGMTQDYYVDSNNIVHRPVNGQYERNAPSEWWRSV